MNRGGGHGGQGSDPGGPCGAGCVGRARPPRCVGCPRSRAEVWGAGAGCGDTGRGCAVGSRVSLRVPETNHCCVHIFHPRGAEWQPFPEAFTGSVHEPRPGRGDTLALAAVRGGGVEGTSQGPAGFSVAAYPVRPKEVLGNARLRAPPDLSGARRGLVPRLRGRRARAGGSEEEKRRRSRCRSEGRRALRAQDGGWTPRAASEPAGEPRGQEPRGTSLSLVLTRLRREPGARSAEHNSGRVRHLPPVRLRACSVPSNFPEALRAGQAGPALLAGAWKG